jgi:hypothetical protein
MPMDLLPSIALLDVLQWVCVAVPFGIVVTASEKPRPIDDLARHGGKRRRLHRGRLAARDADGRRHNAGLCHHPSVVASIAGYMMSHELRRNPELDLASDHGDVGDGHLAAAGLSAFLIDDGAVRPIVLGGAVFGTGLSVGYFLRVRRNARAQ